jgi:hypothetical protein
MHCYKAAVFSVFFFYIRQRHDIDHGTGCKTRTDINSLVYAKEITTSLSNFRKHKCLRGKMVAQLG